ncbi:DUF3800 domain-containing protein [Salaquimonas pukyongi]|uniref:DUF3800 domain-containing protein n=1 Tax=Salaquimonas pukyongi TaxID=2712698 RepID=UPI00096B7085|nr:DUF3800 domain-containing protein [Salaquimonas pukyongi]
MHFLYIDDSTDRPNHIFSAIAVPHRRWNEAFAFIKSWRQHLKEIHNIPIAYELHATHFLSGRGSGPILGHLSRHKRAQIFHKHFQVIEYMKRFDVRVFNVCNSDDDQFRAFERLLNRVNRTMQAWDSYAFLVCDEGKETQYRRLVRRMRVFNPIPSNRQVWDNGDIFKNIPIERILEDPQFKPSQDSFFIQSADFIAHGLLRREFPTPNARKRRIHQSFDQLNSVLVYECNREDAKGIIR